MIGAVVLFGIVVVLGIIIVARGLNRGDPLLPSGGGSATLTGAGGPQPDPELPPDLAELDARLAPPTLAAERGGALARRPWRGGAWQSRRTRRSMTTLIARLRGLPSVQVTLAVALLLLGFLIAAQIAAEGPRVRYSTEERAPLIETALGLQSQQESLKGVILGLRQHIGELEALDPGAAQSLRQLYADLEAARLRAGLIAVSVLGVAWFEDGTTGSVDALVSARDVRTLVEELWLAGAEAIAVNGERIVGSTAVIDIGGSMLVNSAYLALPYTSPPSARRTSTSGSSSRWPSCSSFASASSPWASSCPSRTWSGPIAAFAGTVGLQFAKPGGPVTTPIPGWEPRRPGWEPGPRIRRDSRAA